MHFVDLSRPEPSSGSVVLSLERINVFVFCNAERFGFDSSVADVSAHMQSAERRTIL